jgi:hypothetical protein
VSRYPRERLIEPTSNPPNAAGTYVIEALGERMPTAPT